MELGVHAQAPVAAGWIAAASCQMVPVCLIRDLPVGLCAGQDDHQGHGVLAAWPLGPHLGCPGRRWALWVQTAGCSQAEDGGVLSAIGVWTARVEGHRRGRGEVGSNGTGVGRGLRDLHAVLGCQLLSENGGEPRGARGRASDVTWESSPGNQHSHSTDQEHGELRRARVMRPAGVGVGVGMGMGWEWGWGRWARPRPRHATPTAMPRPQPRPGLRPRLHPQPRPRPRPHPRSCRGCTWAPPGVRHASGPSGPCRSVPSDGHGPCGSARILLPQKAVVSPPAAWRVDPGCSFGFDSSYCFWGECLEGLSSL